jgi:hypothetical protein
MVFLPKPGSSNSHHGWGIYVHYVNIDRGAVTPGTRIYRSLGLRDRRPEFLFHLAAKGWVLGLAESLASGKGLRNESGTMETDIMETGTWRSGVRAWCLWEGDRCSLAGRDADKPAVKKRFEVFFYGKPNIPKPAPGIGGYPMCLICYLFLQLGPLEENLRSQGILSGDLSLKSTL